MTPYDERAWAEIQAWKESRENRRVRNLVPRAVRDRATRMTDLAADRLRSAPGAEQFEKLFLKALQGFGDLLARVSAESINNGAIVRGYKNKGHDVGALEDIQQLELLAIDKVKPQLDIGYITASMLEGAVAGAVVSGGELLATVGSAFGAGAGAAPGVGTIIGTMAADAAAVLVASHRAVAHVGAYYGYDAGKTEEHLFALGVLGVGTATGAGKAGAYIELNKLVQALARRKAWKELNKNIAAQVIRRVYQGLGYKITQRKLGQAVPFLGIILGGGLNARMLTDVVDSADHLYKERFLRQKYGIAIDLNDADLSSTSDDDQAVPIDEILEEQLAEDATDVAEYPPPEDSPDSPDEADPKLDD